MIKETGKSGADSRSRTRPARRHGSYEHRQEQHIVGQSQRLRIEILRDMGMTPRQQPHHQSQGNKDKRHRKAPNSHLKPSNQQQHVVNTG
jgi:hypothetical protein